MAALVCLTSCHPAAFDATRQPDKAVFSFVFAGDPQIGGLGPDAESRFADLARQVNHLKPDFVILAGDLCDSGEKASQWDRFDKSVAKFRAPVRSVIGNHDGPVAYRKRFPDTTWSFTHCNCLFIGIDSNLLDNPQLEPRRQRECDDQWKWLEETLRLTRVQPRNHIFLIMHHPPTLICPQYAQRLASLLKKYEIGSLLCGHIHMTTDSTWNGCRLYTTGGTGWTVDGNGLGFRLFTVHPDRIEQKYIRLEQHRS